VKRINPKTQKPYSRHDTRGKDNKLFFAYTNIVKRDGYFKEIWITPESMEKQMKNNANIHMKNYVRTSNRLPRNAAAYFKNKPKSKADYYKLIKEIRQEPTISIEDLRELLDSGDECVLSYLNVTIPS
jgi:hypothetical protein